MHLKVITMHVNSSSPVLGYRIVTRYETQIYFSSFQKYVRTKSATSVNRSSRLTDVEEFFLSIYVSNRNTMLNSVMKTILIFTRARWKNIVRQNVYRLNLKVALEQKKTKSIVLFVRIIPNLLKNLRTRKLVSFENQIFPTIFRFMQSTFYHCVYTVVPNRR